MGTETRTLYSLYRELLGTLINFEADSNALEALDASRLAIIAYRERELSHLPAQELELARLMREAQVLDELYFLLRTRR